MALALLPTPHQLPAPPIPQNVLLDAAGRAKVCDFGIAKFKNNTLVSSAGGQAGTPAYMAPESEWWGCFVLCWWVAT